MVDTESITSGAKPGVFASLWIAVTLQVVKPDLFDRIHIMRSRVDRPRLVEMCSTSIKVADGQCSGCALRGECSDQGFPVRDLREQIRHVDADEPEHGEIDTDHPIRLGQSHFEGPVFAKGAPGGDEHTVAAGRWEKGRCVSIADGIRIEPGSAGGGSVVPPLAPHRVQFGEPPLVAGAPGGDPIAQPILLHCDLAAELVLLIFLLLEYRIPPTLEGCETLFEHSGDAAVEPDGTLREPFEQASAMADQDDARAQFGQFAFQPLD